MKQTPTFELETSCGAPLVAGCDEAGRGPLCGPVVAAAVIFPNRDIDIPVIIRDSKQMTARARAAAYDWIVANTVWAVAHCTPAEIDELNILWASMLAMERAVASLGVSGYAKSLSIAAASIIAKETRDRIMSDLALRWPQYGWDKNSGYPTPSHLQAIEKYGINECYRKSFGPIKERIKNETSHD